MAQKVTSRPDKHCWHTWFAWHPVWINESANCQIITRRVWWEVIWRCCFSGYGGSYYSYALTKPGNER